MPRRSHGSGPQLPAGQGTKRTIRDHQKNQTTCALITSLRLDQGRNVFSAPFIFQNRYRVIGL